jgi:hypothetical protein
MYEIVTVATHNEGKLDELINNELNIPVTVLGMGKKWTGFRMKSELIYEYIQSMDDNKIIIYLDGFDSNIVGHPSNAIQKFKEKNCKLLFSKDFQNERLRLERLKLNMTMHVFTSCNDDKIIINAGMYMGYVKYLKSFLQYSLSQTCKDDQRNANKSCKHFDFISIDTDYEIFQNLPPFDPEKLRKSDIVFVSYPGSPSVKRVYRMCFELGQFFVTYFLFFYVILIALSIYKKSYTAIIVVTIVFLLYLSKIDRSCM